MPTAESSAPAASAGEKPAAREFDAFAAEYDKALNQGLRFTGEGKQYFAKTRLEWVRRALGPDFQTGWQCLDYGCGTGTAAPFLKTIFEPSAILGVDTSPESIEIARGEHRGTGARFDHIAALSACEGIFDLAYCNGVFHHIPVAERQQAAAAVHRSLKPGGWFAFWENNPWNPVTRLLMRLVPFDRDAILLWPGEARRLLGGDGFRIVTTDFLFIFPAMLGFLRPLERPLCKLPLGGQYLVLARKPLASQA